MIELIRVTKKYPTRGGANTVLSDVSLRIEAGQRVGILGRNGSGKSTLVRLLSGAELPTRGRIERQMSVSWPLAFGGAFQGSLSGLDNIRFVCRVYGVDVKPLLAFIEAFSELGSYLREPLRTYSSGMRAKLAFAVSMAIEFDCYLIDEVMAVGDDRFQAKCKRELFELRKDRAMIMVSHVPDTFRGLCDRVCVLHQGSVTEFDDVDAAYEHYHGLGLN